MRGGSHRSDEPDAESILACQTAIPEFLCTAERRQVHFAHRFPKTEGPTQFRLRGIPASTAPLNCWCSSLRSRANEVIPLAKAETSSPGSTLCSDRPVSSDPCGSWLWPPRNNAASALIQNPCAADRNPPGTSRGDRHRCTWSWRTSMPPIPRARSCSADSRPARCARAANHSVKLEPLA